MELISLVNASSPLEIALGVFGIINLILLIIFNICYFHQIFYFFVGLFTKAKKWKDAKENHKYAFTICARNEEKVLPYLIDSIKKQNYDGDKIKIIVVADNCTDNTAKIARENGAYVIERHNTSLVGKSYALDYCFKDVMKNEIFKDIEGFIIMDADNLLDSNYVLEMNKTFDAGAKVITSLRNAKNYSKSWIAAGQGMGFYRECLLIHHSRSKLGMGTYVSGTGFLVKREVLEQYDGFPFHLMIEDVEFSLDCILKDIKIEYNEDAVFYDEQPENLKTSIKQRLRWCKGTHQCCYHYGFKLLSKFFRTFDLLAFEMFVHVGPMPIISLVWSIMYLILNFICLGNGIIDGSKFTSLLITSVFSIVIETFVIMWMHAIVCEIKYSKKIKAPIYKQVLYSLTFPLHVGMYMPIFVAALFIKPKWVPIEHNDSISIEGLDKR